MSIQSEKLIEELEAQLPAGARLQGPDPTKATPDEIRRRHLIEAAVAWVESVESSTDPIRLGLLFR